MPINNLELHRLTKKALKGDPVALKNIIDFLDRYRLVLFKVVSYLIVYQTIMNLDPETPIICSTCGGKCCKIGSVIPLHPFDLEDLKNIKDINLSHILIYNNDGYHYLPRPCPFQIGWQCSIHNNKPYACLSYPFASEEVQQSIIMNDTRLPPKPVIPDICLAAKKIWNKILVEIKSFKKRLHRYPKPLELYEIFMETKSY